ncbi:hypothetical protein SGPA1_60090 [Streptomyces misionensis JCM 4497]
MGLAGSGSGVWCRASQGGGGRHGGAMATDDNAARRGARAREPGKTQTRGPRLRGRDGAFARDPSRRARGRPAPVARSPLHPPAVRAGRLRAGQRLRAGGPRLRRAVAAGREPGPAVPGGGLPGAAAAAVRAGGRGDRGPDVALGADGRGGRARRRGVRRAGRHGADRGGAAAGDVRPGRPGRHGDGPVRPRVRGPGPAAGPPRASATRQRPAPHGHQQLHAAGPRAVRGDRGGGGRGLGAGAERRVLRDQRGADGTAAGAGAAPGRHLRLDRTAGGLAGVRVPAVAVGGGRPVRRRGRRAERQRGRPRPPDGRKPAGRGARLVGRRGGAGGRHHRGRRTGRPGAGLPPPPRGGPVHLPLRRPDRPARGRGPDLADRRRDVRRGCRERRLRCAVDHDHPPRGPRARPLPRQLL